jgi:hypothetical protein
MMALHVEIHDLNELKFDMMVFVPFKVSLHTQCFSRDLMYVIVLLKVYLRTWCSSHDLMYVIVPLKVYLRTWCFSMI